ncbi:hypothetical protein [Neorhodopirellula lusitana]|uniref:hypothetical protein n=1 Tax=Neorhodopirellula lusitana TaxID=445327 RepID=UPI0024B817EC|nr:hypothetical protein [Neorhodopirellula lusitana]
MKTEREVWSDEGGGNTLKATIEVHEIRELTSVAIPCRKIPIEQVQEDACIAPTTPNDPSPKQPLETDDPALSQRQIMISEKRGAERR